jgi:hypothetical protein
VLGDSNAHPQEDSMMARRLARCTIHPADTQKVLAERAALVAAISHTFPGLTQTWPAKADDQTWSEGWRWDSPTSPQAAIAKASAIPAARPALRQRGRWV